MNGAPAFLFAQFRLDTANARLWRGDREIILRPKTFDVLRYLVEHPGQLVAKTMLLDAVWPGVVVSDSMPATSVKELRKALGDKASRPRLIETVHRRGYRFIAKVTSVEALQERPKSQEASLVPKPIMVGREEELAQLQRWYSHVHQGRRRVVFVAGEAGIGKSTFANAFLDSIAQGDRLRIGRGQCVEQYGAGEPYMPVLEALSRLGREQGGERVVELLRKFAPTWLAQMPGLLTLEERARLQNEIQGVTQQRMLREITEALEALTAESPMALLLEDLHWSDFSTLELISAIARRKEPGCLMVLGTYRPVEILASGHPLRSMKQELELHRYCEELRLRLLNEREVASYLARRLPGNETRQLSRLAPIIHERTDGNPLFMVNVVDYLVEAGLLAASPEESRTLSVVRLDAPRSVRQMVERNLERLKPDEQTVLEGASVVGSEFSAASVAAALERPQTEVEACFTRLSRHEQFISTQGPVVWPDGTIAACFKFQHALYQEVLYDRLSVSHRLQLHQRIAMREEAGYGERAHEVAVQLAHHYSLANVKIKAIQYFQLAGERAATRGAMVEAEEQYRCALKLLGELPATVERDRRELELQLAIGPALIAVKGWATAETGRTYTRARELCDRLGDLPELSPALFGIYAMYLVRGDVKSSRALAEQLLRRAKGAQDSAAMLYARIALGVTSYFMGDFPAALEHLEAGISTYDPERHRSLALRYGFDAGVWSLCYASASLWLLGYPDRAVRRSDEALMAAQELSHPLMVAQAELWASILRQFRREADLVFRITDSLIRRSTEHGLSNWLDWASPLHGWAEAALGQHDEGIGQILKSRAALDEKGARVWWPYFLCLLAEAYLKANRMDDGLSALADALTTAGEYEEREHEAEIHRLKGEILLKQGDSMAAEARRGFERAIEIARKQGAKSWELRATISLARLFVSQGRRDEAHSMLADIYNQFTEGFDSTDLKEAKELLDELRG